MTSDLLRPFRRFIGTFLVCVLLVPAVAALVTVFQPKLFESTATLLLRDPGFDQRLFNTSFLSPSQDPDRKAATDLRLVNLPVVVDSTADALGLPVSDIEDAVQVAAAGRSDLVDITARHTSSSTAAAIANTFADEYISFRRSADRRAVSEATKVVEAELASASGTSARSPRAEELRGRRDQLRVLTALQTGNAELVQAAVAAPAPSSPRPIHNAIVGSILGVLLGASLVYLRTRLDRTVQSLTQLEETHDLPVLAAIPTLSDPVNLSPADPANASAEAFGMLRANLRYFNLGHDRTAVMVTSSRPGEGKSFVAAGLASAVAAAGGNALLIEGDLRRPTQSSILKKSPGNAGLSDLLLGTAQFSDAVQQVAVDERPGSPTFDLVLAGPLPPNPAELLGSSRMATLVADAKADYDLVIIDTPPVSVVPDAVPLTVAADGVLIVVRIGVTDRDGLRRLTEQLANCDAPVLGIVANAAYSTRAHSYYGYAAYASTAGPLVADRDG